MNNSFRQKIINFVLSNQSVVSGSVLFLFSFIVFFVNVVFNQPAKHPLPLWVSKEKTTTQTITSSQKNTSHKPPVRRIPVPVAYPLERIARKQMHTLQEASSKNKMSEADGNSIKDKHVLKSVTQPTSASNRSENGTVPTDIAKVQRLLNQLDLYSGTVDGVVGPQTEQAIKKFEHRERLPGNGRVTPSLLQFLERVIKVRHDERSKRVQEKRKSVFRPELQTIKNLKPYFDSIKTGKTLLKNIAEFSNDGSKLNDLDPATITRIQIGLINFGNHDVPINGKMNAQTKLAIERFQKKFRIEEIEFSGKSLIRKLENIGALASK